MRGFGAPCDGVAEKNRVIDVIPCSGCCKIL